MPFARRSTAGWRPPSRPRSGRAARPWQSGGTSPGPGYPIRTDGTFALPTVSCSRAPTRTCSSSTRATRPTRPRRYGSGMAVVDLAGHQDADHDDRGAEAVKINQGDPVRMVASTRPACRLDGRHQRCDGGARGTRRLQEVQEDLGGALPGRQATGPPLAPDGRAPTRACGRSGPSTTARRSRTARGGQHARGGPPRGSRSPTRAAALVARPRAGRRCRAPGLGRRLGRVRAPVGGQPRLGGVPGGRPGRRHRPALGDRVALPPRSARPRSWASGPVVATYLGTSAYAGSASPARTLTGLKAATSTTVDRPEPVPVQPGADGSRCE